MSKYRRRRFQVGSYYLSRRSDSPAWYRTWVDGRVVRKVSLGTTDEAAAQEQLLDWCLINRQHVETPQEARLADVFQRYRVCHGDLLSSAGRIRRSHEQWIEFHGPASVDQALRIARQEDFIKCLKAKYSPGTIKRIMTDGRSALNRAWRRGELNAPPHVLVPKVGKVEPKGRPMTAEEIARIYNASNSGLKEFIKWSVGTAARPGAIIELDYSQVRHGLIYLLPNGRQQTQKIRPVVRCPTFLCSDIEDGPVVHFNGGAIKSVRTAWRAARKRAKLDGRVQPYSLRHTCARWMRMQGVDAWQCATQLGHRLEGMSTTEIYTAFSPDYLVGACVALEALWSAVQTISNQCNLIDVGPAGIKRVHIVPSEGSALSS